MFGLGGIFVELFKDVNFRVAPLTEEDAKEMITTLIAFPLLNGYRGSQPADLEALTTIMVNVSSPDFKTPRNQRTRPSNPIMAYPKAPKP
jgi:acyl-CoA synthetase (NDP forming)